MKKHSTRDSGEVLEETSLCPILPKKVVVPVSSTLALGVCPLRLAAVAWPIRCLAASLEAHRVKIPWAVESDSCENNSA